MLSLTTVGFFAGGSLVILLLWAWRFSWANNKTFSTRSKMVAMSKHDSKSLDAFAQVTYQEHFNSLMLGRNVKNLYIKNGWDIEFPSNM